MAKRLNGSGSEDKSKVRVLHAEVEGNNETVQEALRTMVSAMSRPVRVVQLKANGETPSLIQQELELDNLDNASDDDKGSEDSSQSEPSVVRKQRRSGAKTDRNAGIAIVHDLNFRPEGHPTLRDFFTEKSPSSDMEQVLVVVYFMQHMMKTS